MNHRRRDWRRRLLAAGLAPLVATMAISVAACGDDSAPAKTPSPTTRSEDQPDRGPQSGQNPAGGEPIPGTSPANG